jgi:hypothetical protein
VNMSSTILCKAGSEGSGAVEVDEVAVDDGGGGGGDVEAIASAVAVASVRARTRIHPRVLRAETLCAVSNLRQ